MRILLVVHQFFPRHTSGTEVLTRDAGVELARRGHEVHVLTADPRPPTVPTAPIVTDYEHEGLKVHSIRLPEAGSERERLRWEYLNPVSAELVEGYVRNLQPDLVHAFHLLHLSASVVDPLAALEVPMVFTATDFWTFCVRANLTKPSGELCRGPNGWNCLECREVDRWFPPRVLPTDAGRGIYFRRVARKARAARPDELKKVMLSRVVLERTRALGDQVSRFDAILAPTQLTRDLLLENGFDPGVVRLSPYGIDTSQFRAARERRLAASSRHEGGLRVGFHGTIAEHKGLHVLVDAFRRLPERADATLRVCGGIGDFPDYTASVLEAIDGDPRINLAGRIPQEQMARELEQIDVLVVPSIWYENAPLVVYSAFAAGVPVVATDLGGMSEVVVDGHNGLLFAPADPEALAAQLMRLADEPGLLDRLARGTTEHRSVTDCVDELLELYAELGAGSLTPA